MDRVRARIADRRVLGLVKAFLIAGVLSEGRGGQGQQDRHPAGPDSLAVPRKHRALRPRRAVRRGVGNDDGRQPRPDTPPSPRIADVSPGALRGRLVVLVSGTKAQAEGLKVEVAAVVFTVGLRSPRRRPARATSTRGSNSSASGSSGNGSEARTRCTSSAGHRRRHSPRSWPR